jgi:hypothetical protein
MSGIYKSADGARAIRDQAERVLEFLSASGGRL